MRGPRPAFCKQALRTDALGLVAVANVPCPSVSVFFFPRTLEGEAGRVHGSVFQSEDRPHQEKGRADPDPTPGGVRGQRRGPDVPRLPL